MSEPVLSKLMPGRHDEAALALLDLVLVLQRLAGDDLAGEDAVDTVAQPGLAVLLVRLALGVLDPEAGGGDAVGGV